MLVCKKLAFCAGAHACFDDERACNTNPKAFVGSLHFSCFAVDLESFISYKSLDCESAQYCLTTFSCLTRPLKK